MVGSLYYLIYRGDFEMASAYDLFKNRKLNSLIKTEHFDVMKITFLENYVSELKQQIGILSHEAPKLQSSDWSIKLKEAVIIVNLCIKEAWFDKIKNMLVNIFMLANPWANY